MTKTTRCPVCQGEIHAIAGKCKHCKADLVDLRRRQAREAHARSIGAVVPPIAQPAAQPYPPAPPPAMAPAKAPPSAATVQHPQPARVLPPSPPPPGPSASYRPVTSPAHPSSGQKRWPIWVSAVALLAIGISVGMLAERWRSSGDDEPTSRIRSASASPHQVPDFMPSPIIPDRSMPRNLPGDPDPGTGIPNQTLPPSSRFAQPQGGGDAGAFRSFANDLSSSLCKKLSECGVIDTTTQVMCTAFAQQLDSEEAAAKVASGECSFNQRAADECLRAVSDLSCDLQSPTDMMDFLMTSNRVGECTEAYVCN